MPPDAVSAWPSTYPIGRTLVALVLVPPMTLVIPSIVSFQTLMHPAAGETLSIGLSSIGRMVVGLLILSWPGYVIFAGLGIPILLFFFRFKLARFWEFAVVGMICTEIPWLVIASTSGGDAATVHALLRGTLPIFAAIGIGNGIITRLIVLGIRKPL